MFTIQTLFIIQGTYFLLSGLWPLLHIRSFMKVTGYKADAWLVKMVGVLVSVMAMTFICSGMHNAITPPTMGLAFLAAAGLTAIDIIYVCKKVISRIYLVDAAVQLSFCVSWIVIVETTGIPLYARILLCPF